MKQFLSLLFLIIALSSTAQELSDSAKIYLLTCSPGSELYNTFGHTGIEVIDPANDLDIVFNFGLFDFRTEQFYLKFLRGKLPYKLGIQKMASFMYNYKVEKRTIYQQELNLNGEELKSIYWALVEHYKPENREYKYDFFFDNCSTRPRDIFEDAINLQYAKDESSKTYRNILDEYLGGLPWSDFGIDLIIGSVADKQASQRNQMFIPDYLHDHIGNSHKNGQSVVLKENLLLDFIEYNEKRKETPFFTPCLLFGFLLLLECLFVFLSIKGKFRQAYALYNKLWFFILGLSGMLVAFMWFGTEHIATKLNWNLLWLNPLYLFLMSKGNSRKFVSRILLFLVGITLLGFAFIPQALHHTVIIILLIILIKLLYAYYLKRTSNERV